MYLKNLKIIVNGEVRREISFRRGLNLILDGSVSENTDSGNSVGKTTALRAIGYCFGSNIKYFFEDPEFKDSNEKVKNFFLQNLVVFTLEIEKVDSSIVNLQRQAVLEGDESLYVNNEHFKKVADYISYIRELVYLAPGGKPTLPQIMSRFIRNTTWRMSHALKSIHAATPASQYEALNLFLFHFGDPSLIDKKQESTKRLNALRKKLSTFKKEYNARELQQAIAVITKDISKKEIEKASFRFSESYKQELSEIQNVRSSVSDLSMKLSKLDAQLSMNKKMLLDLENSKEDIDPSVIRMIYEEAGARVGSLTKTFEDSLDFHNRMIDKKMGFIERSIPAIEETISELSDELDRFLALEKELLSEIQSTGSLADLEILQRQINELYESKGKFDQALDSIRKIENDVVSEEKIFSGLVEKFSRYETAFDRKIEKFNSFFSSFTKKLYGEEYFLFYQLEKGKFEFKISSVSLADKTSNHGEGTKKALISAFDLSYLSYMDELQDRGFRFVAHDGIEAIHENQVKTLFDIANNVDGQYIVSTLTKTVEFLGGKFIGEHKVLELDTKNKFFGV